jgi:hypothetical protein
MVTKIFKKNICSKSLKIFKAVKVFRAEDRTHLYLTIEKGLNTFMELLIEKSITLNLKYV